MHDEGEVIVIIKIRNRESKKSRRRPSTEDMSKRPFIESYGGCSLNVCAPGSFADACGGDGDTTPRQSVGPSPDAMDSLVAAELNQLSLEEREAVFEDLHGVTQVHEESPECVASQVEQLKQEIKKIRGKSAYDKALFLCPKYTDDPKFYLMFLRAENYNIRLAAHRMVLHFKHKLDLFGVEKLAQAITMEDLDEDDKAAMLSGGMQFLPEKDRSGRTVVIMLGQLFHYKTVMNQVRYVVAVDTDDKDRN
jgi:hypothetical protein